MRTMSRLEKQLFVRLLWSLFALLLILSVTVLVASIYKTQQVWQNKFNEEALLTSRAIKSLARDLEGVDFETVLTTPYKQFSQDFLQATKFSENENSVLIDSTQKVLIDSKGAGYNLTDAEISYWNTLADKTPGQVVGNTPDSFFGKITQKVYIRAITFNMYDTSRLQTLIIAAETPHVFELYREVGSYILLMDILAFLALAFSTRFFIGKILRSIGVINNFLSSEAKHSTRSKLELNADNELQTIAEHINYYIEELDKRNAQQAMFSANASHQLRTPLTVINSYAEALAGGIATAEESQEFGAIILRNCERMQMTTDALLQLTRIDNQTGEQLAKTPTDIAALVREQLEIVNRAYPDKQFIIDSAIPDTLVVLTNQPYFLQIVHNILENAAKYTPAGGKLALRLTAENGQISFSAKDSGIGIAAEDLPRIFDRFFRADKSHSQTKGSGLGLAIVQQIVELLSGEIKVTSAPGQGTEFTVILPC